MLANKLNAGFIPIRKPGKLPAEIYSQSYELEYGFDTLEIHQDALDADDIVLIHDDLLATANHRCCYRFGQKIWHFKNICEFFR